ncbi:DUF3135 domain-containing protein [Candidatus Endoriftia persephone]|jgi:hypothetical protein|uniref:DUF3135 domain-containing protein n=3 Tax=Gammaproteobacteria TaxID=1236 RepID=G2FGK4_9GAMM|nr:DUF3135 domain-containing protein [Candidatus Endoriftia persephone]EGW54115.1 hypothetical protein TevJSym_aq00630 [endosymbiont of Tevnia jerichonana (vent Tica)]USF87629.1 DUF3135 domain-containing protein [Candidatus Endoriftia persephone]
MKKTRLDKMDFDAMCSAASADPEGFEQLRQEAIENLISQAPQERQKQLRSLQWRIDQERRNGSPLSACVRISRMMWVRLAGSNGLLDRLEQLQRCWNEGESPAPEPSAKILNFPPSLGDG